MEINCCNSRVRTTSHDNSEATPVIDSGFQDIYPQLRSTETLWK